MVWPPGYKETIMICCPMCGLNRPLVKTGAWAESRGREIAKAKGVVRFDVDLDDAEIIQVRQMKGRKGLPMLRGEGLKLCELKDNEDYEEIVDQIRRQAHRIVEILGP